MTKNLGSSETVFKSSLDTGKGKFFSQCDMQSGSVVLKITVNKVIDPEVLL